MWHENLSHSLPGFAVMSIFIATVTDPERLHRHGQDAALAVQKDVTYSTLLLFMNIRDIASELVPTGRAFQSVQTLLGKEVNQ